MSVMGTGVASGVAQTGLQAQDVARQRDKQGGQAAADVRRVRQTIEALQRGLEAADDVETTAPRVDEEPTDQDGSPVDAPAPGEPEATADGSIQHDLPAAAESNGSAAPLYRHLDLRA